MDRIYTAWGGMVRGSTAACRDAQRQTRERWRMEEAGARLSRAALDALARGGQVDRDVECGGASGREET